MKNTKSHLSIRLIYNLSRILFWIFAVISTIIVVIAIILHLFVVPAEDYRLSVSIPTNFKVEGRGFLDHSDFTTEISIYDASGTIAFDNPPRSISVKIFLGLIPLILVIAYSLWIFKTFTYNVKKGKAFDPANIGYLKRIAYILFGIWVYIKVVIVLFNIYVVPNIAFDGLEFSFTSGSHFTLLAVSLFIWVLSHIFQKGAEIEEENLLTV